jgi:hypothetical protein
MSNYTPGPWQSDHENMVYGPDASKTMQFAEIIPAGILSEANARLIAAAPELLAALRESIIGLKMAQTYLDHPDVRAIAFAKLASTASAQITEAIERYQATVAKATA